MSEQFDFSTALFALKKGERIQREGWNGKGMWLILVHEDEYTLEAYKYFDAVNGVRDRRLQLLPFIAMKTADGGIVPWLASQTDLLAEDWIVL